MGVFFGTDGLRGRVNDDLSFDISYKVGNALGKLKPEAKVIIGRDTRRTGALLTLGVAGGLMNTGASVTDVGVCPTAGIAYLTMALGYDYGVVISASHNPAEYNGIKIFDKTGKKLGDKIENQLERNFLNGVAVKYSKVGSYAYQPRIALNYEEFLEKSISTSLKGKTIVLDCSHGSSYKIAPSVFRANGAKIIATYCKPDGLNINDKCGSLNINKLQKYVLKYNADMGFAFDGDSDRVIAVDENGQVVDGDKIIYLLATTYKEQGKLNPQIVVGTRHTNMGIEKALNKKGITMLRTDIGDKYVSQKLEEKGLLIGGEQSGHVFVKDVLPTGDGVLNALLIAEILAKSGKTMSSYFSDFKLYHQENLNVKVYDKMRIINSEALSVATEKEEQFLGENARIMIRVSGTEPYIRIMVESLDASMAKESAQRLKDIIESLSKEFDECAE